LTTGWGTRTPTWETAMGKQLVEDVGYRQDQVKRVGLGFELPESLFGLRETQTLDATAAA